MCLMMNNTPKLLQYVLKVTSLKLNILLYLKLISIN